MTTPRHPAGHRLAAWGVLAVVALHSAAVALWVSPPNIIKDHVGYDRLKSYVLPMFDQSWSVFAPEADNEYDLLELRARVSEQGSAHETDWIKVTAHELAPRLRYHPFPSRTVLITDRLASDQLRLFNDLSEEQKQVINRAVPDMSLAAELDGLDAAATSPAERDAATQYIRTETAIERYLSGIADAVWGSDVVSLQLRQNQVFAPNYQTSHAGHEQPTGYLYLSNWRPVQPLSAAERSTYRSYVHAVGLR